MSPRFNPHALRLALCLAFPGWALPAFAAEPYPALPPALSTSVTPNVMLYIDTSGSMLQDSNNAWMRTNLCNSDTYSNGGWAGCVNDNPNNYRTTIDDEALSPNTKMNIAKRVSRSLVNKNSSLRFGLFSFDDHKNDVGGLERAEGGVLRADIRDMSNSSNKSTLLAAIGGIYGRTATPLGEGLFEVTRYFEGKSSMYSKMSGNYTSPIQYRCQKNFAIVITDGDASGEDNLPGSGKSALAYTARDGNGAAVAKSFSVCTAANATAANDVDVNCPAGLEKSDGSFTASQAFSGGQDNGRFRAIRDVAKYAQVADLRVSGTDLDGKSFDDPKFAKQNLTTYTVGFTVNNDVLPAAAKVGGGKYYNANNETELSNSLQNAIDSISASISNAGGVATQSETTIAGNKVFQPVFNPAGWYGELRCYSIASDGSIGSSCLPNAKAVITTPTTTSRKVYSSKVISNTSGGVTTAVTTPFVFSESNYVSDMTAAQQTFLGADTTTQQNTIKFIRGVEGISGFRSRYNGTLGATVLLGDIVDSQPTVIAKPSGSTPDTAYPAFVTDNASRNMVLIGANDGMLHAFNADDMTELLGYIPSTVYPRLKALTAADYGQSAGTPHAYHVNGNMKQQDIKVGTAWKTIAVGGLGQGGQGYYALDVTNASKFAAPASAVKWEWNHISHSSMGYSFGSPLIYNVRTSASAVTPAVILSNGYESNWDEDQAVKVVNPAGSTTVAKVSTLYILNANTGAVIKTIVLPASSTGLSSPAGVDVGQDGILDYVYAGDVNGKLWRFDLTANDPANFKVITTPIFDAGAGHPIVMRPGVMPVNKASDGTSLGNVVLFGTGQLLTNADRSDTTVQTFYGILDSMSDTPTTVPKTDVALQKQTFATGTTYNAAVDTYSVSTGPNRIGTYRKVSTGNTIANSFDLTAESNTKQGWYIDLPDSSERLVTSPLVFDYKVLFGTGTPMTSEKCLPGGKGWVIGLNPLTGSVVRKGNKPSGKDYSFIDINGDGKSSVADKLPFSSGDAYLSGYQMDGIPTELTYVSPAVTPTGPTDNDTGRGDQGSVIALREANSMAVFTGNARYGSTVDQGHTINRPAGGGGSSGGSTGCGSRLLVGTVGSDTVKNDCGNNPPTDAVKIETTTWREITQ